jgi:hypothetical protein
MGAPTCVVGSTGAAEERAKLPIVIKQLQTQLVKSDLSDLQIFAEIPNHAVAAARVNRV